MKGCENWGNMTSMAGISEESSCYILDDLKAREGCLIKTDEDGVAVIKTREDW